MLDPIGSVLGSFCRSLSSLSFDVYCACIRSCARPTKITQYRKIAETNIKRVLMCIARGNVQLVLIVGFYYSSGFK